MSIRFDGQVAIVTGAGNGLGRSHALELARRGAKVVVNDLGGARDGSGGSASAAQLVADEIAAMGGEAMANAASVTDRDAVQAMADAVMARWGRIDILINNAGILRDKSFSKMEWADIDAVIGVHLKGAFNCCKAVWEIMKAQAYGRILMTTSSSGIYGNFGQANYSAAKLGQMGLMHTLHLEGAKYNIHVNSLCPIAATRMTNDLLPPQIQALFAPELVTPAALFLVSREAPSRVTLAAGAGGVARVELFESEGLHFPGAAGGVEQVADAFDQVSDFTGARRFGQGGEQTAKYLKMNGIG